MQEDLVRKIVVAADTGDLATVKQALKEGASPDAMGPNSTASELAAYWKDSKMANLLK